jgi:hypothetical protein
MKMDGENGTGKAKATLDGQNSRPCDKRHKRMKNVSKQQMWEDRRYWKFLTHSCEHKIGKENDVTQGTYLPFS